MTTFFMRLCTIAPAHIWHGSNVTYIVQSSNRQSPVFLLAFLIAVNSACANVFPSVFLLLYPLAIIVPSCTITHPIGTSSRAYAFFASRMAAFIYFSSCVIFIFLFSCSGTLYTMIHYLSHHYHRNIFAFFVVSYIMLYKNFSIRGFYAESHTTTHRAFFFLRN